MDEIEIRISDEVIRRLIIAHELNKIAEPELTFSEFIEGILVGEYANIGGANGRSNKRGNSGA